MDGRLFTRQLESLVATGERPARRRHGARVIGLSRARQQVVLGRLLSRNELCYKPSETIAVVSGGTVSDEPLQEPHHATLDIKPSQLEDSPEHDTLSTVREGLPRNFRMRADRHYVDLLARTSVDQPVRMVPIAQLEAAPGDHESDLRPLIESIRVHGIVHPLVIRRRETSYSVVAGRKRLHAARALRIAMVPCLVRELNDAEAAAVAMADNVVIQRPADTEDVSRGFSGIQRLIAHHLSVIRGCSDICAPATDGLNRPALDLLKAHVWRATMLVRALDLIADVPVASPRERSLAGIVDEVLEGFGPEARLAGISIRAETREDLSSSGLSTEHLLPGIAGGLLATIALAAQTTNPTIIVKSSSPAAGAVALDIGLPDVAMAQRLIARFFDPELASERPGGQAAAIGALATQALANRHGGTVAFEAFDWGCRLRILMTRRS